MTATYQTGTYAQPTTEESYNPYVGIRPFEQRDSRYFFGRDEQSAELLAILRRTRFLPVVGSSGSGKSSLVLAGLLPRLLGGFLIGSRDRWRIAKCRPGSAPMHNLADAIATALDVPNDVAGDDGLEARMRIALSSAVTELAEQRLDAKSSLLVIVDQFEELFKFRGADVDDDDMPAAQRQAHARARADAADFVDLLLGLASAPDQSIYVVLTMRSDFLGDCDVFLGLPDAMNRARYLVPRLSRDQLREAIEGPALMQGAELAARLVDTVLNGLGDRPDRLPVLQHALQRTWDVWAAGARSGPIDLEHLRDAGGLDGALEQDATRALRGLDERVVERVFRSLTDTDRNRRRVRRACRMSVLAAESFASRAQVERVVAAFVADDRNFLFVSDDGDPLDPRVDISHEALIRQWPKLRAWVDAEVRLRDTFLRLVGNARDHRAERRDLLTERELAVRSPAWDEVTAAPGWAQRYCIAPDDFSLATRFVEDSREAIAERHREVELTQARRRVLARRRRQFLVAGIVIAVLAAIYLGVMRHLTTNALAEADRELLLGAIRELSTSDPTMAASLVAELDADTEDDSRFSWSDVAAFGRVANEDVAERIVDSAATVDVGENTDRYALLLANGDLLVGRASQPNGTRRIHTGATSAAYVSLDDSGRVALITDATGAMRALDLDGASAPRALLSARAATLATLAPTLSRDGRVALAPCAPAKGDTTASGVFCTWDVARGGAPNARGTIPGECRSIAGLDLNPDGTQALVACDDGAVAMWTPRTGETRTIAASEPRENVSSARLSHDGRRILLASYLTGVRIWEPGRSATPQILSTSPGWYSASFDRGDTLIVAVGRDGARVWRDTAGEFADVKEFAGQVPGESTDGAWMQGARFSPDGRWIVSWTLDAHTYLWRATDDFSNDSARVIRSGGVALRRAAFAGRSLLITVANDTTARLWSMVHDPEPFVWHPMTDARIESKDTLGRHADVSASGRRIAFATGNTVDHLFFTNIAMDPSTGVVTRTGAQRLDESVSGVNTDIDDVRFDGEVVHAATHSMDSIFFYTEGRDGTFDRRARAVSLDTAAEHVALDALGQAVSVRKRDASGLVWTLATDSVVQRKPKDARLDGHHDFVSVVLSRGGRYAVSVPNYVRGLAALWDTRTGATLRYLPATYHPIVAFDSAGKRLVWSETDNRLRIAPVMPNDTGSTTLRGACCRITALAFGANDQMIAAGDTTGAVNLWTPNVRPGMLRLPGSAGSPIVNTTFTSDGHHVLAADHAGAVRIWTFDPEMLIRRVKGYTAVCAPARVWVEWAKQSKKAADARVQACEKRRATAHAPAVATR